MTFLRTKITTQTEFHIQARNKDEAEQFALAHEALIDADYAYVSQNLIPAQTGAGYLVEVVAEFDFDFDETYTKEDADSEAMKRFFSEEYATSGLSFLDIETNELDD
jgi:hypothetical protein